MENRAHRYSGQSIRVDPVMVNTFDWKAELETAKRHVVELEEMVFRLREALEQKADDATPIDKILDRARRTLSVRMASLERAKFHQRFIEHKIQSRASTITSLPYIELAHVCFSAAEWMPKGEAAESVRAHAAAFYTKGIADQKASPTVAAAKAVFHSMATGWTLSDKSDQSGGSQINPKPL